jgi:hypothetical protein
MTFSHHWTQSAAFAALYGTVSIDDGTPVELDRTILDGSGNPIYLRRPVALSVETGGMHATNGTITFGVPAGATVAWWSLLDVNSNVLVLNPITASVRANIPQPCLFDDLATGWIKKPGGITEQQGAGTFVVFSSGPSPSSTLYSTGGYTTLPGNVWSQGTYAVWPVRDSLSESFRVNNIVGRSDRALHADVLVPSNRGWGYWQRFDPVTYVTDGTYTLDSVRVRTVG